VGGRIASVEDEGSNQKGREKLGIISLWKLIGIQQQKNCDN
jgi:hypothetical protein